MAGLGAGSHLGGVLSTRLEPRRALFAFVGLELVIGVFGVASCGLYYDLLYLRAPSLFASPVLGGFVQLSLLPPTLLMGMSLPFLVRGLLRDVGKAGRVVGFLYGINTSARAWARSSPSGCSSVTWESEALSSPPRSPTSWRRYWPSCSHSTDVRLHARNRSLARPSRRPASLRPLAVPLCLLGLLRPVSRGPLVPDRGRRGEGVRLSFGTVRD